MTPTNMGWLARPSSAPEPPPGCCGPWPPGPAPAAALCTRSDQQIFECSYSVSAQNLHHCSSGPTPGYAANEPVRAAVSSQPCCRRGRPSRHPRASCTNRPPCTESLHLQHHLHVRVEVAVRRGGHRVGARAAAATRAPRHGLVAAGGGGATAAATATGAVAECDVGRGERGAEDLRKPVERAAVWGW